VRWLYLLLIAAPAALIAEALHASALVVFVLAALGLVPLAGLIGLATEALAERLGSAIGGLLNATFGNAAEIIIALVALSAGLPEVVRASLAGSIIGNSLLVLGLSVFVGGWRYRKQRFNARVAGQYSVMMLLAVIGMAIPSLLATIGEGMRPGDMVVKGNQLHQLSIGIACILLLCYVAYIAYSVFGLRAHREDVPHLVVSAESDPLQATSETGSAEVSKAKTVHHQPEVSGPFAPFLRLWHTTLWLPLLGLAAATVVTAIMSEALVGTIEPLTEQIGLNPFFVGLIILPLVGNAAEHFSAVTSAARNDMEVAMAITAGSSIQIALLAAPILVLAGTVMGTPLDLNFTLLEVAMFGLAAVLYALISNDGETTWLEGVMLLAFYLILAVGTFATPL
jgi:Ca2+:H+ antiporter